LFAASDGSEWNYACSSDPLLSAITPFISESAVAVPDGEEVVKTEHGGCSYGE